MKKEKREKKAKGEKERESQGYYGAQDTFYVGNIKRLDRIYPHIFIDTYSSRLRQALYCKTPITAADLLNDRVEPFYDAPGSSAAC